MEIQKITYQYAEIGHWLARCNHQTKVIELNAREFNSLSPLLKDYIWVHECVHLLSDVRDETECNRMTDQIFISRAKNDRERNERQDFVNSANDKSFTRVIRPAVDQTILAFLLVAVFLTLKKNVL